MSSEWDQRFPFLSRKWDTPDGVPFDNKQFNEEMRQLIQSPECRSHLDEDSPIMQLLTRPGVHLASPYPRRSQDVANGQTYITKIGMAAIKELVDIFELTCMDHGATPEEAQALFFEIMQAKAIEVFNTLDQLTTRGVKRTNRVEADDDELEEGTDVKKSRYDPLPEPITTKGRPEDETLWQKLKNGVWKQAITPIMTVEASDDMRITGFTMKQMASAALGITGRLVHYVSHNTHMANLVKNKVIGTAAVTSVFATSLPATGASMLASWGVDYALNKLRNDRIDQVLLQFRAQAERITSAAVASLPPPFYFVDRELSIQLIKQKGHALPLNAAPDMSDEWLQAWTLAGDPSKTEYSLYVASRDRPEYNFDDHIELAKQLIKTTRATDMNPHIITALSWAPSVALAILSGVGFFTPTTLESFIKQFPLGYSTLRVLLQEASFRLHGPGNFIKSSLVADYAVPAIFEFGKGLRTLLGSAVYLNGDGAQELNRLMRIVDTVPEASTLEQATAVDSSFLQRIKETANSWVTTPNVTDVIWNFTDEVNQAVSRLDHRLMEFLPSFSTLASSSSFLALIASCVVTEYMREETAQKFDFIGKSGGGGSGASGQRITRWARHKLFTLVGKELSSFIAPMLTRLVSELGPVTVLQAIQRREFLVQNGRLFTSGCQFIWALFASIIQLVLEHVHQRIRQQQQDSSINPDDISINWSRILMQSLGTAALYTALVFNESHELPADIVVARVDNVDVATRKARHTETMGQPTIRKVEDSANKTVVVPVFRQEQDHRGVSYNNTELVFSVPFPPASRENPQSNFHEQSGFKLTKDALHGRDNNVLRQTIRSYLNSSAEITTTPVVNIAPTVIARRENEVLSRSAQLVTNELARAAIVKPNQRSESALNMQTQAAVKHPNWLVGLETAEAWDNTIQIERLEAAVQQDQQSMQALQEHIANLPEREFMWYNHSLTEVPQLKWIEEVLRDDSKRQHPLGDPIGGLRERKYLTRSANQSSSVLEEKRLLNEETYKYINQHELPIYITQRYFHPTNRVIIPQDDKHERTIKEYRKLNPELAEPKTVVKMKPNPDTLTENFRIVSEKELAELEPLVGDQTVKTVTALFYEGLELPGEQKRVKAQIEEIQRRERDGMGQIIPRLLIVNSTMSEEAKIKADNYQLHLQELSDHVGDLNEQLRQMKGEVQVNHFNSKSVLAGETRLSNGVVYRNVLKAISTPYVVQEGTALTTAEAQVKLNGGERAPTKEIPLAITPRISIQLIGVSVDKEAPYTADRLLEFVITHEMIDPSKDNKVYKQIQQSVKILNTPSPDMYAEEEGLSTQKVQEQLAAYLLAAVTNGHSKGEQDTQAAKEAIHSLVEKTHIIWAHHLVLQMGEVLLADGTLSLARSLYEMAINLGIGASETAKYNVMASVLREFHAEGPGQRARALTCKPFSKTAHTAIPEEDLSPITHPNLYIVQLARTAGDYNESFACHLIGTLFKEEVSAAMRSERGKTHYLFAVYHKSVSDDHQWLDRFPLGTEFRKAGKNINLYKVVGRLDAQQTQLGTDPKAPTKVKATPPSVKFPAPLPKLYLLCTDEMK